jgi:hypothetical protein
MQSAQLPRIKSEIKKWGENSKFPWQCRKARQPAQPSNNKRQKAKNAKYKF